MMRTSSSTSSKLGAFWLYRYLRPRSAILSTLSKLSTQCTLQQCPSLRVHRQRLGWPYIPTPRLTHRNHKQKKHDYRYIKNVFMRCLSTVALANMLWSIQCGLEQRRQPWEFCLDLPPNFPIMHTIFCGLLEALVLIEHVLIVLTID